MTGAFSVVYMSAPFLRNYWNDKETRSFSDKI